MTSFGPRIDSSPPQRRVTPQTPQVGNHLLMLFKKNGKGNDKRSFTQNFI